MSYLFVLTGNESTLSITMDPPIHLNDNETYVLGFLNFIGYNSIPNVDLTNNKFHIGFQEIIVPVGSYEVADIQRYIKNHVKDNSLIDIKANLNTSKCEISSNLEIDFREANSIGKLLGFNSRYLKPNVLHESDNVIRISKVDTICINCNIVTNSFNNGKPVHILHTFSPNVEAGFKMIETPTNIIYLPINTRYINEITVQITDQDGNLVNFNRESVAISLNLKKL